MPNAIADPESRPCCRDAEAQVLAVADRAEVGELAAVDEQRHARVAEPERREPASSAARPSVQLRARHDRVDARHRLQVVVGQHLVGVRGERRGERLDALGLDRQAGRGAMAAEALEVRRARGERRRAGRTPATERPEPFHVAVRARRSARPGRL